MSCACYRPASGIKAVLSEEHSLPSFTTRKLDPMALQNVTFNMNLVSHLNEHRFDIWKEKFISYLYSHDERMPHVLTMGPLVPMMVNTRRVPRNPSDEAEVDVDEEDVAEIVPKPRSQ